MASVMGIVSEVYGSYVEEINISVEVENRDAWLCCGWNYLRFVLAGKAAKDWGNRWVMVPGNGGAFRHFGLD
jgi:hypothetical protein